MGTDSTTVEEISDRIRPILESHGVERAALYGSTVEGTASETSDVDVLVELPEDRSLLDLVALKRDLEQELDRDVDIAEYGSLHPMIADRVRNQQVGVV